ncbi:MAG: FAD-dependent oxidoreductase [Cytophagales bacterium]|nr:FAD-dependent oxidoreductase [Cytophagales bacterium]
MRVLFLLLTVGLFYHCDPGPRDMYSYDIVIVGGGASGTMAGVQAARLGSKTLIVEESPWLGGMLTSAGVSAIDGNYKLNSGLWHEFRLKLYDYYGGEDRVKTGWVSNVLFEPDVGAGILAEMAGAATSLDVWFNSSLLKPEFNDRGHWTVSVRRGEKTIELKTKIIIDATELGDVSKAVGIPYDIGMDSRHETLEEIAPDKSNDIIQDLTYVAILKDYGSDRHLLDKPNGYDPSLFYCTCAGKCAQDTIPRTLWACDKMLNYGRLPNNKYMINWPIFGNDYYVNAIELDKDARRAAFERAKWFTKCYVYYLQDELGFTNLGIADDVFPTKDGFPFIPYHRESRRIKGIVRFDINDLACPFDQEDALYRTGIAVGDYPVDHHHEAYPESHELPDLHFYPVPSYTLPLGTLIPKKVKNFIVAEKSISVTNLVNGTTRLQPVCLLIGQAAGVLAHLSVRNNLGPGDVDVRSVQSLLVDHGVYIMPYSDLAVDDPAFGAVQRIGATGILRGEGKNIGWENHTLFHPDSVLTYEALKNGLGEFKPGLRLKREAGEISVGEAVALLHALNKSMDRNKRAEDVEEIWKHHQLGIPDEEEAITRKQFAVLLDQMVDPFHLKRVDHFGNFLAGS